MQNLIIENRTKRAVNRDKGYWREVIIAWKKSGEAQKDFCAKRNIKLGTFSHWKVYFSKENKEVENKFIELQVRKQPAQVVEECIIECPTGHKIIFNSLNVEEVTSIFKLLGLIA